MPLPPPGTFRLYPFAEPPLPAGRYTLTGDITGLPGPVETMSATVDVVAPRYALPPDQILSTFPPAGARGSFTRGARRQDRAAISPSMVCRLTSSPPRM